MRMPVWPVARKVAAIPRARISRSMQSAVYILPTEQSVPTARQRLPPPPPAVGDRVAVRRHPHVVQLAPVRHGGGDELGLVAQEVVQARRRGPCRAPAPRSARRSRRARSPRRGWRRRRPASSPRRRRPRRCVMSGRPMSALQPCMRYWPMAASGRQSRMPWATLAASGSARVAEEEKVGGLDHGVSAKSRGGVEPRGRPPLEAAAAGTGPRARRARSGSAPRGGRRRRCRRSRAGRSRRARRSGSRPSPWPPPGSGGTRTPSRAAARAGRRRTRSRVPPSRASLPRLSPQDIVLQAQNKREFAAPRGRGPRSRRARGRLHPAREGGGCGRSWGKDHRHDRRHRDSRRGAHRHRHLRRQPRGDPADRARRHRGARGAGAGRGRGRADRARGLRARDQHRAAGHVPQPGGGDGGGGAGQRAGDERQPALRLGGAGDRLLRAGAQPSATPTSRWPAGRRACRARPMR